MGKRLKLGERREDLLKPRDIILQKTKWVGYEKSVVHSRRPDGVEWGCVQVWLG